MDEPLPIPDAPPQWDAIQRDISCPLCDYNLRGLIAPRCPECGYRSTWPQLLDPWRIHPYLFEHHPRHNWRSFWKTAFCDLRPLKFWSLLQPQHKPDVRRLAIYWLLNTLAGVLIFAMLQFIACAIWQHYGYQYHTVVISNYRPWPPPPPPPPPPDFPSPAFFALAWNHFDLALPFWFAFAYNAWMLCTLLAMRFFSISLRGSWLNMAHVFRCIVYSFDGAAWAAILSWLPLLVLDRGSPWTGSPSADSMVSYFVPFIAMSWLFAFFRLTVAQYRYLRFSHAWAVVLATQIIPALVFLNLYALYLLATLPVHP